MDDLTGPPGTGAGAKGVRSGGKACLQWQLSTFVLESQMLYQIKGCHNHYLPIMSMTGFIFLAVSFKNCHFTRLCQWGPVCHNSSINRWKLNLPGTQHSSFNVFHDFIHALLQHVFQQRTAFPTQCMSMSLKNIIQYIMLRDNTAKNHY